MRLLALLSPLISPCPSLSIFLFLVPSTFVASYSLSSVESLALTFPFWVSQDDFLMLPLGCLMLFKSGFQIGEFVQLLAPSATAKCSFHMNLSRPAFMDPRHSSPKEHQASSSPCSPNEKLRSWSSCWIRNVAK